MKLKLSKWSIFLTATLIIILVGVTISMNRRKKEFLFEKIKSINASLMNSDSTLVHISDMPDVHKDLEGLDLSIKEKALISSTLVNGEIFTIHGSSEFGFEYQVNSKSTFFGFGAIIHDGYFYCETDFIKSEFFDLYQYDDLQFEKIEDDWYEISYIDRTFAH